METWLVYALITAVFSGIANFFQKIAVENRLDTVWLIFANAFFLTVLSLVYVIFYGEWLYLGQSMPGILTVLFVIALAQFSNTRVRAEVLKYLSASEYFVSARILTTGVLTLCWIFFFSEVIASSQFIGLALWSLGIILLFEEDTRLQHSRSWLRAIYLLVFSVFLTSLIQIGGKYVIREADKIAVMLFYEGLFMLVLFLVFYRKKIPIMFQKWLPLKQGIIPLLFGLSIYIATVCNFLAFKFDWPVGIVSKIIGYSLFIPIILSMLFFHEKFSMKKWIAFFLTIISIYYLN